MVRIRVVKTAVAAVALVGLVAACSTSNSGTGTTAPSASPAALAGNQQGLSVTPVQPSTPVSAPSTPTTSHKPAPPPPNHCAGNTISQLVKVSLADQHLWLCAKSKTVLDTPITSGASSLPYDSTPTGNFRIQGRDRNSVLTLNTGKQYDVKYWIPFNAPLFGFHDSSWQNFPYGSAKYKTQGSHGCVHMPLKAIAFLYNWVQIGATVHIRAASDPV
jgi:lipoprotein-anchoring transpeptidase ErfK/SrfK